VLADQAAAREPSVVSLEISTASPDFRSWRVMRPNEALNIFLILIARIDSVIRVSESRLLLILEESIAKIVNAIVAAGELGGARQRRREPAWDALWPAAQRG